MCRCPPRAARTARYRRRSLQPCGHRCGSSAACCDRARFRRTDGRRPRPASCDTGDEIDDGIARAGWIEAREARFFVVGRDARETAREDWGEERSGVAEACKERELRRLHTANERRAVGGDDAAEMRGREPLQRE